MLTEDGFVRTYDPTIGSELSFEVPDLSLDLYALAGRKRYTGGFAADQDEMTPASCCFGSGDHGWRPLTLYILMRNGDVYGLNPLVPSRWIAPPDSIQLLSLDITAELETCTEDTTAEHRTMVRRQTKWINDVLNQEAAVSNPPPSLASPRGHPPTCLTRPLVVGPEPVLQGPFLFDPAPQEMAIDDCPAGCDIFHIAVGPVGVLGIVYSHGKLDICVEPEALPARWVDKRRRPKPQDPHHHHQSSLPVIASYESIDLGIRAGNDSEYTSWPTLTKDAHQAPLLFVNHLAGVTAFSMKAWLSRLESMLDEDEQDDEDSLSQALDRCPRSQIQKIVDTSNRPVDGCWVVYEAYIGYLLIASHSGGLSSAEFDEPLLTDPFAAAAADLPEEETITLEPAYRRDPYTTPRTARFASSAPASAAAAAAAAAASASASLAVPRPPGLGSSPAPAPAPAAPPKLAILQPPYQPSQAFATPSALPQFLRQQPTSARAPFLFCAETLDNFKSARQLLKSEFDVLMVGAQEMHDRAAAQRLEYSKQLECLHSLHGRLGALRDRKLRERLERFIERQRELQDRADGLLRQLIIESELGLSDAEKRWRKEVDRMIERVSGDGSSALGRRTLAVSEMVRELRPEAVAEGGDGDGEEGMGSNADGVPGSVREGKLKVLRELLERECAPPPPLRHVTM